MLFASQKVTISCLPKIVYFPYQFLMFLKKQSPSKKEIPEFQEIYRLSNKNSDKMFFLSQEEIELNI